MPVAYRNLPCDSGYLAFSEIAVPILFLDIDGVLNRHKQYPNGYCGICPTRVALLNRIVEETGCLIVLSSAWRYMILRGDMTIRGFRYMLLIHGATQQTADALVGTLPEDVNPADLHDRAKMVLSHWHEKFRAATAAALDDLDLGYTYEGVPFVKTCSDEGLTYDLASAVISLLKETA